jgi:GT2 family glycosyltransferase
VPTTATHQAALLNVPTIGATCTAVVVHYRNACDTLACIASLRQQPERVGIVVVDNQSPDDSWPELSAQLCEHEDVTLLRSEHNGGFGAGCNQGINIALKQWPAARHLLLLNPDATLAADALGEMIATANHHPQAGIVGCRIDDSAGQPWFQNGHFPRWTLSGFHRPAPAAKEHETEFVTGACMLIACDLLRAGLRFDETYFLYCEDADLCSEVASQGRQLWITQNARATHRGGASQPGEHVLNELSAERLYWLTRAKVLLARKRLNFAQRCGFLAIAILCKPIAGLWLSKSTRFLWPYLRGLASGLVTKSGDKTA